MERWKLGLGPRVPVKKLKSIDHLPRHQAPNHPSFPKIKAIAAYSLSTMCFYSHPEHRNSENNVLAVVPYLF